MPRLPAALRLLPFVATLALLACQAPPTAPAAAAGQQAGAALLRQDAIKGAYEVAYQASAGSVFVASAPSFDKAAPGYLYRLDARDLSPRQTIQLQRRAFALGLNRTTNTLYVGNTLDGSLTVVDAASGIATRTIQLGQAEKDKDGQESMPHTRKVIVDEARNRIFVTSPGSQGKVWIIDGASGTVTHQLSGTGRWSAGAVYDAASNRLYVSQGGVDEVLVIDPDAGQIVRRLSTGDTTNADDSKHFLINIALDAKTQRLFTTDSSTNQLYVWDIASGKVLHKVALGLGALEVAFNPQRNEIYTTHRGVSRSQPEGSGGVTVIDATSYAVKRVLDLPVHPNSLALTPDGQTLYVTVKAPHGDKHPAFRKEALDSVVRIDLRG
ncbi:YncE family protein [Pseudorhodoferax sp.]|uniref:YncE family protein n=1 Tax=Pseudorhodoferax sp. TaxID=1993553 RepID=UPI002DD65083|nr:YncE family protein [Pseudorhodoferax sp.]